MILSSDGDQAPPGYEAMESSSILTVDRNLDVTIQAL